LITDTPDPPFGAAGVNNGGAPQCVSVGFFKVHCECSKKDVVEEVLQQEDNKIIIAITAACLHFIECGSATKITWLLPNQTTANYHAVVRKTIALKGDKLAWFTRMCHLSLKSSDTFVIVERWKERILSLQ
jgi:hypothetical protein